MNIWPLDMIYLDKCGVNFVEQKKLILRIEFQLKCMFLWNFSSVQIVIGVGFANTTLQGAAATFG